MSGIFKVLKITEIVNYYENPRHEIATNEEDTLKKLFNAVGTQYMLNLAEDIQKNGLLGNQHIVVVYSDSLHKYIVYEGNRRVAVLKLLLFPEQFNFLDRTTVEKIKKIQKLGKISEEVSCYVTDEKEAFFIMERVHSGEDKGRGIKHWSSREKEIFRVRQNHAKNLSYLIDFYVRKYFDDFDITTILPFTTIQRIFNNREVKKIIGLDIADEASFSIDKMKLIIEASRWIKDSAENSGYAVTRLFNKARAIEDQLVPWLAEYQRRKSENTTKVDLTGENIQTKSFGKNKSAKNKNVDPISEDTAANGVHSNAFKDESQIDSNNEKSKSHGGQKNLPYFFQGLDYSNLNPDDPDTHGVSAVCRELQLFSAKRLVAMFPIAATFLIRSLIEQSIKYYSKKHSIQGQNKLIWENIKNCRQLNKLIDDYMKNLSNYIKDPEMRSYFENLFKNYEDNLEPLNWVIHRPAEFQLGEAELIRLPRRGLLKLINYMISK